MLRKIIVLKLKKIVRRVEANYGAELNYGDDLIDTLASRCTEVESGARNVDNIINRTLLPALSATFLEKMANGEEINEVTITVGDDENFVYDCK